MNLSSKSFLVGCFWLAVAFFVAFLFFWPRESVTLIATEDMQVYDTLVFDQHKSRPISSLRKGDSVSVVACIDQKSDIVPEVQLDTGERGYVHRGSFRLERKFVIGMLEQTVTATGCY
jgi:hypothetical protein